MTCDEVSELAGLYVLGALEPAEHAAVTAHLASCAQEHDEVRELGGVVPVLASTIEPIDAPAELKARVMAAVRSEQGAARSEAAEAQSAQVKPWTIAAPGPGSPTASRRRSPPAWASWGSAVAALLVLAVIGVWALGVQTRADRANLRAQQLADAVALLAEPDSSLAYVRGTGSTLTAAQIRGFAVFHPSGQSYLVMVGLSPADAGKTYQAWYLVDGTPASAGLMSVEDDGYAVLVGAQPPPGTNLVALTLEPEGGSDLPTTEPFAAGEVRPPA